MIVTPVTLERHAALRYSRLGAGQGRANRGQASKGKIGYLHLRAMGARHRRVRARLLRQHQQATA
jgi:tricorn protease